MIHTTHACRTLISHRAKKYHTPHCQRETTHAWSLSISHRATTCVSYFTAPMRKKPRIPDIQLNPTKRITGVSHSTLSQWDKNTRMSHIEIPRSETQVCLIIHCTTEKKKTHGCHILKSYRAKHIYVTYFACIPHIIFPQRETYLCPIFQFQCKNTHAWRILKYNREKHMRAWYSTARVKKYACLSHINIPQRKTHVCLILHMSVTY